jgi:hypothetical protein
MPRPEIYIRSIDRRWKKEIRGSSKAITIVSPYITSKTAERIVSAADAPNSVVILTLFNIEVFASGASSIKTLQKLMHLECEIFHAHNLHAKIFLTENFASIGSQNLTSGGAGRNQEASVGITDERSVTRIRKEVSDLVGAAYPVSKEMIDRMLEILPPLRREFLALERKLQVEQSAFSTETSRRRLEALREEYRRRKDAERREENKRKIATRSEQFQKALQITQSSENIPVSVTHITTVDDEFMEHSYVTMAVENRQRYDMRKWVISGKSYYIPRVTSCLIVNETDGRLSYVRVMKGQTNRFYKGVKFFDPLRGWHRPWYLENLFADTDDELAEWNVCFNFRHNKSDYTSQNKDRITLSVFANFTVSGLEIVRTTMPDESHLFLSDIEDLRGALAQENEMLINDLNRHLLDQNFNGGWINTISPSQFFLGNKRNWLRLHKFDTYLFLGSRPRLY